MTKEIQIAVAKMQVLKYHPIVCENISPLFRWEMDVMSISKSGMMYEFEVKISRSDFKADAKKGKQSFYDESGLVPKWTPNFFSYVCPDGLIKASEIALGCGLFYFRDNEVFEIIKPKKLHSEIHDKKEISLKALRLHQERTFLGCARLTYENRILKDAHLKRQMEHPLNEGLFNPSLRKGGE